MKRNELFEYTESLQKILNRMNKNENFIHKDISSLNHEFGGESFISWQIEKFFKAFEKAMQCR